ncbi:Peptide transporter PTR2 [Fonsecaea pedrosoi]|nr:Peptide transporter PTR2 [Fonsecaea pedrosoi]
MTRRCHVWTLKSWIQPPRFYKDLQTPTDSGQRYTTPHTHISLHWSLTVPVDNAETARAGGLQHLEADNGRQGATTKNEVVQFVRHDSEYDNAPTQEELHGPNALRRVAVPIPWSVYTVAFVELCERFSYYGTQVVYSNFVNHSLPLPAPNGPPGSHHNTGAGGGSDQGISGALGQGPRTANGINTFNTFWVYCVPLLGAYMADEHWGRYKTICVHHNTTACYAVFMLGLIIMGFGTGSFKPNISPLIVEQIDVTRAFVKTLSSGERVIVDPIITQSRIYHYFYLFINIGALVGQIGMVYAEKYVGFWLSFLLPLLAFLTTPFVMWWGRNRYQQRPPAGSVVTKAVRCLVYRMKGRWSFNPVTMWKHTSNGSIREAVKPSNIQPSQRPVWMTFDDAWVDEVRRGFAACAVFCYYPLYWLAYGQLTNNFTAQAGTMKLNGVPNDVVNNLDPFALIIFIPLCDSFLYPGLRKLGFNFTALKKITAGFWLAAAAMIWAAVVQFYIYKRSPCGYQANSCFNDDGSVNPAPLNVWIQTGCYVLIALSEIFASITSLELSLSSQISAAIAEALNRLSGDPLLVWNYGVFAVVAFVGGCLFIWQFWSLDQQKDELNLFPGGFVVAQKDVEEVSISEPLPHTIDEKK